MPQAPQDLQARGEARRFLRRYALDTLARVREFSRVRARGREAEVLHGDARELDFGARFDGVVTSPPYPGLIDYHEQHRYAYELLGLEECRELELGKGHEQGRARRVQRRHRRRLRQRAQALKPGAPVVIVINDRRELYPAILERAGLRLEERYRRHVNRRTGRRSGEYYEDILVAR